MKNTQKFKKKILLFGGMPRSGNHLLRALLDGHRQLAVPPDEDYFVRSLSRSFINRMHGFICPRLLAKTYYKKMQKNGFFEILNNGRSVNLNIKSPVIDLEKYYRNVRHNHRLFMTYGLLENHLNALQTAIKYPFVTESSYAVVFSALNPHHSDLTKIIRLLGKKYKFSVLVLMRDPVSQYASARKRNYVNTIEQFCSNYNAFCKEVQANSKHTRTDMRIVWFEELVRDCDSQMHGITQWLRIDYEDILCECTCQSSPTMSNSSFQSTTGVNPDSLNYGKHHLRDEEIKLIRDHTNDHIAEIKKII